MVLQAHTDLHPSSYVPVHIPTVIRKSWWVICGAISINPNRLSTVILFNSKHSYYGDKSQLNYAFMAFIRLQSHCKLNFTAPEATHELV